MLELKYKDAQEAWEELHRLFLNQEKWIEIAGGGRYGGQLVAYDVFITMKSSYVSPGFDFGNMFGYRKQKWSGLKNNYVDDGELLGMYQSISEKEAKGTKNYNISMPFVNKHGHGKNCLLSFTCSRRFGSSKPIISFNLRSSEITKRLLMDLVLINRLAEHLYPEEEDFELRMFATNIYCNPEAYTMYDNHRKIKKLLIRTEGKKTAWQKKILQTLRKFKTCNLDDIGYKVHKRCVRQLQRPNGIPLSGDHPMLVKDLKL